MYRAKGVFSYVYDHQNKQFLNNFTEMVFVMQTECVLSEVGSYFQIINLMLQAVNWPYGKQSVA